MKSMLLRLFAVLTAFSACTPSGTDSIKREDLFSIDIGPMEDQLALYSLEEDGGIRRVGFTMRDGFFYIADGNGGKVVRYNSYGDLLFLIYNEEITPNSGSLKPKTGGDSHVIRWAFTYPFFSPSKITVDTRGHIYVEERLPNERYSFDAENKVLLDSVILHFDEDGQFIEYLGQGGPGGEPFPKITGLYTSENDEVAVVCRMMNGWNIYWYGIHGEQIFLIQLTNNAIPVPPDWSGFSTSVDAVMAAPDARKLFIKVDYYQNIYDKITNTRISTEPVSSLIWVFDVDTGVYGESIEVPFYEYSYTERGRKTTVPLLYTMLGLARDGRVLLYFPVETGYEILLIYPGGRQQRGLIRVDPEELRFNDFHFSPEGILCALLADAWKAKLVWWRMDRLAQ